MAETTIYWDEDASISTLDGKTVAMIGYGKQGRPQSLMLRESGVEVIVGNQDDEYVPQIEDDGFEVHSISEAAAAGDVIGFFIPDEVQPEIYRSEIEPHLEEGNVLHFASGYNISYDLIQPPEDVDVIMVAPRMPGETMREWYQEGKGYPSLMAVNQDYSGEAKEIALAFSKAIGSTRGGVMEGTFDMETILDLLLEAGPLPVMIQTIMSFYEIATDIGIPPEVILTELYLSREIAVVFEHMATEGILNQLESTHSTTSQYAHLSRIDELEDSDVKDNIKDFLSEQLRLIDNGTFAKEWTGSEQSLDRVGLKRLYNRFERKEFFEDEQKTMDALNFGD